MLVKKNSSKGPHQNFQTLSLHQLSNHQGITKSLNTRVQAQDVLMNRRLEGNNSHVCPEKLGDPLWALDIAEECPAIIGGVEQRPNSDMQQAT